MQAAKISTPTSLSEKTNETSLIERIRSRQTSELIVAFCGPLGSGVSHVAALWEDVFRKFSYSTEVIKISDIIVSYSENLKKEKLLKENKYDRIKKLQDEGNILRKKFGNDILSVIAIHEIAIKRDTQRSSTGINADLRRHITIIDSLKHPSEAEFLKSIYGDMFYIVGVLCPENVRIQRLNKTIYKANVYELIERDKSQEEKYGQQLLKVLHLSDFFINNSMNDDAILKNIKRSAELMLGEDKYTPTLDEYAMFIAQSTAVRSGCMSRQVGAAIFSGKGDIISTGRNDVPRPFGGLYCTEDGEHDMRCMTNGDKQCYSEKLKDKTSESIANDINAILKSKRLKGPKIALIQNEIQSAIASNKNIKGLIEFSRAVHAEMDAITTAARNGSAPLEGATLYCTTYPCHHCARHIVSSGIKKVIYIEPYEKSLAGELHFDSISNDNEVADKVAIIPFQGVSPKQYLNMFAVKERKKGGVKISRKLDQELPSVAKFVDSHLDYEQKVVQFLLEDLKLKKS